MQDKANKWPTTQSEWKCYSYLPNFLRANWNENFITKKVSMEVPGN